MRRTSFSLGPASVNPTFQTLHTQLVHVCITVRLPPMSCRGHRTVFKSLAFLHENAFHTSWLPRTKPRYRPLSTGTKTDNPGSTKHANSWILYPATALLLGGAGYAAHENELPFRHALLAVMRCSRIAGMCTRSSYSWYAADRRRQSG